MSTNFLRDTQGLPSGHPLPAGVEPNLVVQSARPVIRYYPEGENPFSFLTGYDFADDGGWIPGGA